MAEERPPNLENLPAAVPVKPPRFRLPHVWLIPAVVIVIGVFVVIEQKVAEGPTIEIRFHNAEGLEANKTTIRYKDVEIGEVKNIRVAGDRKMVIVIAQIHRDAQEYLVDDTRFWVVRPRISAGAISGLGTLLSGAYIGVDVGNSKNERRSFAGLEVPPIVTSDQPGREFILRADNIGSLTIGSRVFYRHIYAGQVVAYAIDPTGATVTIRVFIYQPYDRFVTPVTRFWQASGIDMAVDSEGVKLHTESLAAIIEGGVAFQAMSGAAAKPAVAVDTTFDLYPDQSRAMQPVNTEVRTFIMYFKGSLRGLSAGATVELRGIPVGEVKRVYAEYDREQGNLRFPVEIDIYPQRIRDRYRHGSATADAMTDADIRTLIDSMVARGLRAELKTANLLTEQKYIAMDLHTDTAAARVDWNETPPIFPTVPAGLEELQDSLASIAKKIDKVPFDEISARLLATIAELQQTLKTTDRLMQHIDGSIAPQVSATLAEAQAALKNAKELLGQDAPLPSDLSSTLLQVSRAAKSLNALLDYLQRHPESLLRGKPGDPP